jgi:uncharacterized protein (TIGR03790 family)
MADRLSQNSIYEGDFGDGFCYHQSLMEGDFYNVPGGLKWYCPEDPPPTFESTDFIFVYRKDDADSREVAEYYADAYGLEKEFPKFETDDYIVTGQLVGVNCSTTEILTETAFDEQVTSLIILAMASEALKERDIWGITLGYNVPGGFNDGGDIISSTSRVARGCSFKTGEGYHSYSKKTGNKFYRRSIYKGFDEDDAQFSIMVSRIDGPSVAIIKEWIDNMNEGVKTLYTKGKFYIDPYSDRATTGAADYTSSLVSFSDNILPTLNLETWETSFIDPYIDAIIPQVEEDSFTWSWFTNTSTSQFFKTSSAKRTFFYNADYDGALSIRDSSTSKWPLLSLNAGYISTAGSMSDPTIGGFLDPEPFFKSLKNFSTIGEAYLYSVPYLDWTVTLFGDLLATVNFPAAMEEEGEEYTRTTITWDESWYQMSKDISRAVAKLYKIEREIFEIRSTITDTNDLNTELTLLNPINNYYQDNRDLRRNSKMKKPVSRLFEYPERKYFYDGLSQAGPTCDLFLTEKGYRVSSLLLDVAYKNIISDDNILDEGWWEFEYIVQDDTFDSSLYHFILEVSTSDGFGHEDIVYTFDSGVSTAGWKFENDTNQYVDFPFNGVGTGYVGRRVLYQSRKDETFSYNEYLIRGETYYFRMTQYNSLTQEIYESRLYTDIIYT